MIPVCFGGRPGIIRAAVLTGSTAEAPLLVSLPILKSLGAEFSLKHRHVKYTEINTVGISLYNTKGQLCLDLFDFKPLTDLEFTHWKPRKMLGDECTVFLSEDIQSVPSFCRCQLFQCSCYMLGKPNMESNVTDHLGEKMITPCSCGSATSHSCPNVPHRAEQSFTISNNPAESTSVKPCAPFAPVLSSHELDRHHGGRGFRSEASSHSGLGSGAVRRCDSQMAASHTEAAFGDMLEVPAASDAIAASSSVLPDPTHDLECTHEHLRGDRRVGECRQSDPTDCPGEEVSEGTCRQEGPKGEETAARKDVSATSEQHGIQLHHRELHSDPGGQARSKAPVQEESQGESQSGTSVRRRESEPMLLRDHSNASHLSQAGPQLDASVLSLQPRAWLPVPILHVDWAGQVHRVSGEDIIRGDEPSSEGSPRDSSVSPQLEQYFESVIHQRCQSFEHQEPSSEGFQIGTCSGGRLGSNEHGGQRMCSSVEPLGNQFPSRTAHMQAVRPEAHLQVQDRRDDSRDAFQQQQQQAQEQEAEQVKSHSTCTQIQTVKHGVRKRLLGELNQAIRSIEDNSHSSDSPTPVCHDAYHIRMIGEVFSVPRFSARASAHDLTAGQSFDLELGHNFLCPSARQQCIHHLRERRYGLVTVSSPCTLFSNLQFLAKGKTKEECFKDPIFLAKYKDALTLLHFGITVCHLQIKSGCTFLFEQPWNASSWKQANVKQLLNTPGVQLVRTDQCAFGQCDLNGDLIRKRTGFATNCAEIARRLRRSCPGNHKHVHCIGTCHGQARASQASKYSRKLVDAVLKGYVEHLEKQGQQISQLRVSNLFVDPNTTEVMRCEYGWDSEPFSKAPLSLLHIELWSSDQEGQPAEHEDQVEAQPAEDLQDRIENLEPSRRRSLMHEIEKAHRGLGHPHQERFLRILRAGKASDLVLALAKTYECAQCKEEQRPKPWRRAAPPRELSFNEVVGVDTITLKHFEKRIQCLNCICWGTRYQLIIPLKGKTAADLREAYRTWVKLFGAPRVVRPDLGREFLQEFAYRCGTDGSIVDPISLEAPTQAAITEREGKSFKMMFSKAGIEVGSELSDQEVHELIDITCMVKNRLVHRGGFSAIHRAFGFTPYLPGEFLQGDETNIMSASANIQGDLTLQKQEQMRLAAGRAFFGLECHQAIKRAIACGHRKLDDFQIGQEVFFWSVSIHRKVGHPNSASRKENHQMWHGPAHVIAIQHPTTVFLNYQGRLIKAAPEQCRRCSVDEIASCSEIMSKLCRIRDELKGDNIKGLQDITSQEKPPASVNEHPTGRKRYSQKQPEYDAKKKKTETFPKLRQKRPLEVIDLDDHESDVNSDVSDADVTVKSISDDEDLWVEQCWIATQKTKDSRINKEVKFKDLSAHDQKLFREAIKKEWDTNIAAGAISILTPQQSREVRQQLSHRIMQSRLLLTCKPVESKDQLPPDQRVQCVSAEQCCKAKARWIARGDKDPDVFQVESSSPVIGRDTFFLGLQMIASKRWRVHFADFSQAFMQGSALNRHSPLYCELPTGGPVPGIDSQCLIQIHKTVYGLTDAPFAWNRHLDKALRSMGYRPSVVDPCLYMLDDPSQPGDTLAGIIMLATDDLVDAGNQKHQDNMQQLYAQYRFGKWEYDQGRFCGKDLQQLTDHSITVSQEYYAAVQCKESLHVPRNIPDDQPCDEEQVRWLRAKLGILSWLAKETRVDLAGAVALLMQCMPNPTVRDMKRCNQILKDAYLYRDIHITVRAIPVEQLAVVISSDAAWGNAVDENGQLEKCQAGYVVMMTDQSMLQGAEAPFSMVAWKSHTLKRRTVSTLGAETQAIVESASVACWFRFMITECLYPQRAAHTTLGTWEEQIQHVIFGLITDAKSVYDALSKNSPVTAADKRVSIDLSIIRSFLQQQQGCIRWIDGKYQLSDSLTKVMPTDFLRAVLALGRYQLKEEYDTLQLRSQAKIERQQRKEQAKAQKKVEPV